MPQLPQKWLALGALVALTVFVVISRPQPPTPVVQHARTARVQSNEEACIDVVAFGDAHGAYQSTALPDGDIFVFSGDAGVRNDAELVRFDGWLAEVSKRFALVIVVAGNMDGDGGLWRKLKNGVYLDGNVTSWGPFHIFGSPWTPPFVGNFQFGDEEEAAAYWGKVFPSSLPNLIVVTHGPAYGVLDTTSRGAHVGDRALAKALQAAQARPLVHIFGHIHASGGQKQQEGGMVSINVSQHPMVVRVCSPTAS